MWTNERAEYHRIMLRYQAGKYLEMGAKPLNWYNPILHPFEANPLMMADV